MRYPSARFLPARLGATPFTLRERFSAKSVALAVVFGLIVGVPVAALSLAASASQQAREELRETAATADAPALSWRAVAVRHAGFDVDAPRWKPLGPKLTVLRRSDGLSRELFQFGEAMDGRRHAAIAVDRGEIDAADAGAAISGLLGDIGLDARVAANPIALETKFGPLPTADMTIAGEAGPKACLAFTMRAAEAGLRVTGWVCNAGPELVSRAEAACFLDRLFAVGLRETAIAAIFARAELRRQPTCSAPLPAASAAPVGTSDRNGRPVLRTGRL